MTYKQAYSDHSYLWKTYGPAYDMTGGYVDQDDLDRLLKNPTKARAKKCLSQQIDYFFCVGPDDGASDAMFSDARVDEIANRYGCAEDYEDMKVNGSWLRKP